MESSGFIACSQCSASFSSGYDYRMHWEKHLDDYLIDGKMNDYYRILD